MRERRLLVRAVLVTVVLGIFVWLGPATTPQSEASGTAVHETTGMQAGEALKVLLDGNKEYVAEKFEQQNRTAKRRLEVAGGQHPFAVIVGCSDSRVPPEVIFNRGIGDLFVVRSAGHVVDDLSIGSIEYAVEHLGVRLILVLGHKKCGAVGAALQGGKDPSHIGSIVEAIRPAVDQARKRTTGADAAAVADRAMMENVRLVAEKLKRSKPVLAKAIEEGHVTVAGGYYDLESGKVIMLPDQE